MKPAAPQSPPPVGGVVSLPTRHSQRHDLRPHPEWRTAARRHGNPGRRGRRWHHRRENRSRRRPLTSPGTASHSTAGSHGRSRIHRHPHPLRGAASPRSPARLRVAPGYHHRDRGPGRDVLGPSVPGQFQALRPLPGRDPGGPPARPGHEQHRRLSSALSPQGSRKTWPAWFPTERSGWSCWGFGTFRSSGETLRAARRMVRQGIEQGAVGFSTGAAYYPGYWADTRELVELCRAVREAGGVYVNEPRVGTRLRAPIGGGRNSGGTGDRPAVGGAGFTSPISGRPSRPPAGSRN